jgi:hypothetical protein
VTGVFIRIEGCSRIRIEGCLHTAPAAGAPSVNRCNPLQARTGNKRAICTLEARSRERSASVHDLDIVGGRRARRQSHSGPWRRPPPRGATPPAAGGPGRRLAGIRELWQFRTVARAARVRSAGPPQARCGPSPGSGAARAGTSGAARREHDQMRPAGPAEMLLTWAAARSRKGAECFEPSFNWGNLRKPLYKDPPVQ